MASSITFDLIDMTSPVPSCLQAHPLDISDSIDEDGGRNVYPASNCDLMDCDMDVGCKDQPIDFCLGQARGEAILSPVFWKQPPISQLKATGHGPCPMAHQSK